MSWQDLDIKPADDKAKKESLSKAAELAKAYSRCFATDDGQRVLQDLTSKFIYGNDVSLQSANINYEAAFCNGEGSVVKFIIHHITRAKEL